MALKAKELKILIIGPSKAGKAIVQKYQESKPDIEKMLDILKNKYWPAEIENMHEKIALIASLEHRFESVKEIVKQATPAPLDSYPFEKLIEWRDTARIRVGTREVVLHDLSDDWIEIGKEYNRKSKKQHSDLRWIGKLNKVIRKKAGV